jgi:2-haloacid dehalogenase
MMQRIEAVLFDTFGTVVDWRTGVATAWRALAERRGITLDADDFADQWRAKYLPAMAAVRSGERRYEPLDQLHLENLLEVLADNGVDSSRIPAESLIWLNQSWQRLNPWPDVLPGLKRLKRHYLIGPLSNGNMSLLTQLARYAGLPWDAVIGSDLLMTYKPDPKAYRLAAELLDIAPCSIMLCAAHNGDLAAASAAGFRTAFLCRPNEHGPGQRTDLAPLGDWDAVTTSVEDLADQLEASRLPVPDWPAAFGDDQTFGGDQAFAPSAGPRSLMA